MFSHKYADEDNQRNDLELQYLRTILRLHFSTLEPDKINSFDVGGLSQDFSYRNAKDWYTRHLKNERAIIKEELSHIQQRMRDGDLQHATGVNLEMAKDDLLGMEMAIDDIEQELFRVADIEPSDKG